MTSISGNMTPALGVVTVTYNAAKFLLPFLECCSVQTHKNFQILIIDNDSSDSTLEILTAFSDARLKVIANSQNIGYAAACNQGVKYFLDLNINDILLINNDTDFRIDLFESLQSTFREIGADALTPRITYADNHDVDWYAGGHFSFWKGFQGEHSESRKIFHLTDSLPRTTQVAPGCCVLFSASTFNKVGLFDPSFFVYSEDTDFFIRMRKLGLCLIYAPSITIAHKVSLSTGGPQSDFTIRYHQRNQIYLLRKHFSVTIVIIQFIIIFLKATFRFLTLKDSLRQYFLRLSSMIEGLNIPIQSNEIKYNNK